MGVLFFIFLFRLQPFYFSGPSLFLYCRRVRGQKSPQFPFSPLYNSMNGSLCFAFRFFSVCVPSSFFSTSQPLRITGQQTPTFSFFPPFLLLHLLLKKTRKIGCLLSLVLPLTLFSDDQKYLIFHFSYKFSFSSLGLPSLASRKTRKFGYILSLPLPTLYSEVQHYLIFRFPCKFSSSSLILTSFASKITRKQSLHSYQIFRSCQLLCFQRIENTSLFVSLTHFIFRVLVCLHSRQRLEQLPKF